MSNHIRGKAKDISAGKRRALSRTSQSANQERSEGINCGSKQRQKVIRRHGAEVVRDRKCQKTQAWYECPPSEIEAERRPERLRNKEVQSVSNRVRPPNHCPNKNRPIGTH